MNVLFWNLKQNPNEKWVADLTREKDVDIAVFAEYQGTSFEYVLSALQDYVRYDGYGACEKITMLCKQSIETTVKREQNRYTLYSCKVDDVSYNIVGIHLPAPPHADANDRKNVIRDIVHDISEQEREEKNELTIIIGDFNCNPFDEEIIQKDTFNAVLYKPLIRKKEEVLYNGNDVTNKVKNGKYTITNVQGEVNLSVTFKIAEFNISVVCGAGGNVTASAQFVNYGESVTFAITPDEGRKIESVFLNGIDITNDVVDSQYTIYNIKEHIVLTVTFGYGDIAMEMTSQVISVMVHIP